MALLYGVHDQEGAQIVPPGGWCVALVELSSNPAPVNYAAIRPDINWLVRLNWGYGSTGTIPLPGNDNRLYIDRLAHYVHNSQGVRSWIIGNEPNHEQERPNGVYITPERYADFFARARTLIKTINSNHRVIPAPCAPYHANPTNWLDYWRMMLEMIAANGGCDALAIHAYLRRHEQDALYSTERMGGVLGEQFSGFFTYRDALSAVPAALHHLPVHITEFNPIPGWKNENNGLVQAAYKEINWWNQQPDTQKIHSLSLYRFPNHDKWGFQDKLGVIQDFQQAVSMGFSSPHEGQQAMQTHELVLPSVKAPTNAPARATQVERKIDPRAIQRGVKIAPLDAEPAVAWRVVRIRWFDEQEADRVGPDHHILMDTLDEQGKRIVGVPLVVVWPDKVHDLVSEAKPGEPYSANFPMSPAKNGFAVKVNDDVPSETVLGIGMGADTPDGFNAGIHTSTEVIFQRIRSAGKERTPVGLGHNLDNLAHPVEKPEFGTITQGWGERPEFYSRYAVDGVALKGHNGLDFGTPVGTPIVAVDTGQVVEVHDEGNSGYGKYVKLVHAWGESLYAHLSRQLVRVGDTVKQGQMVGFSGNTGNSTGPHLHFGMRVNPFNRRDGWGGFINPAPYLKVAPPKVAPDTARDIPREITELIKKISAQFNLEWQLLASMVWAESSFNSRAESSAGAIGLMQLMPATFDEWAERVGASDIWLPEHNLKVGAAYLKYLINYMNGDVRKALWSYVWGMGRVKAGNTPPAEVLEYANKILHGRDLLKAVGA